METLDYGLASGIIDICLRKQMYEYLLFLLVMLFIKAGGNKIFLFICCCMTRYIVRKINICRLNCLKEWREQSLKILWKTSGQIHNKTNRHVVIIFFTGKTCSYFNTDYIVLKCRIWNSLSLDLAESIFFNTLAFPREIYQAVPD